MCFLRNRSREQQFSKFMGRVGSQKVKTWLKHWDICFKDSICELCDITEIRIDLKGSFKFKA